MLYNMKAINEEFDRYVLSLNELITSESRAKLHNFYVMHKADLMYFKHINEAINQLLEEKLLLMDSVETILSVLTPAIPMLCKMRQTIEALSKAEICSDIQPTLKSHINYIKNSMLIEGIAPANDQLNDLLHLNKTTIAEKIKLEKDAARKAELERKRKEERAHEKAIKHIEHDFSNRVKIMSEELSTSIMSKQLECMKRNKNMRIALCSCILIIPIVIALPLWFIFRSERNALLSEIKSMNYTIQYLNSRQ